ncbi:hypothetical protein ACG83_30470 [Frankia sp. R43]|nr:hypothetical protein ACG83_30470 [Frankia sp. R43]
MAKHTFGKAERFAWWRLIRMLRHRHRWRWTDVRRRLIDPTGRWQPITEGGTELFRIDAVTVSRCRYRAGNIPNPWIPAPTS